jgi:hypothetical protein
VVPARHKYHSVGPGAERSELVIAPQLLHLEPGVRGVADELVCRDESERVVQASARRGTGAPSSKIVAASRGGWSGRTTPALVLVTSARLGIRPQPVESRPSNAARSVGTGSQTSTTAGPASARAIARSAARWRAGVVRMRIELRARIASW